MTDSLKFAILAAAILSAPAPSSAQARPDTLRMGCTEAASLVRRAGAVLMQSGPNIYDRYVVAQNFCQREEMMVPRWAPTADNPQCFVGYVCQRESWGPGPQ